MTARNDITGDAIRTGSASQQYRDNWESIFRTTPLCEPKESSEPESNPRQVNRVIQQLLDLSKKFNTPSHERGVLNAAVQELELLARRVEELEELAAQLGEDLVRLQDQ